MDTRLQHALGAVSAAAAAFLEATSDRTTLLQTVVRTVAEAVPDLCSVSLRSDGDGLTVVAVHDADPSAVAAYAPLMHHRRPLSALAAQALGTPVFLPNLDLDAFARNAPADSTAVLRAIGARGLLVVPLRSRGELLGLLSIVRRRADLPPLDETDREIAQHLANHAALALSMATLASERQRLATDLAASRFLDAVIENIPDMVFVKDADELRFVRFNRAGEELLGISRTTLLGKSDRDLFPPAEAEFFTAKDRETLAAKSLIEITEEPIQTQRGQRWLHTKKVPIVDDTGTPRYLLGISEDITDRKDALRELAAARDKAEAANRELEAFSYSVAHDLRAPLRAIDGFAQALLDDYTPVLDDSGQRLLSRIRGAAQRMAMLIDDLLALSRVTRAEPRREPVNLSLLAELTVAQLERADPERKVDVVIADDLDAMADPKLMGVVIDNLIGNAWKFTSKVAGARIELACEQRDREIVYVVRDNGAGFDMAYQSKLFGVFQRLHPATEFPGTGVGLATVKRIVERHGGRIWAESEVGKGAAFFFTLGDAARGDA